MADTTFCSVCGYRACVTVGGDQPCPGYNPNLAAPEPSPDSEVERLRAALRELRTCQVDEVMERDDEGRAVVGFTRDMTAKEVREVARRALENTDE